ncbi:MAG: ATP/GTP-binding protein [Tomitella sp.]|nr:ATP/GTP-binding protein [Tomitella sp.]
MTGVARTEEGPHGDTFHVRSIPSARATKRYRCPGCDQEIMPSVAHVVAWPASDFGGPDERRHWHTGCWASCRTRSITRRWS